ncbi:VCBS repeat-containing protein [Streptomyces sp. NBC_00094]|uniref:FG-GAP repeat domain-containing protein n=1 Tax=Streptomyces sp. NBC_00094 TaxID=2903620 RepID=UPI002255217B|nr:VCBS repeat-containing protein [Streptomyces sp. NBC_00094]MCX5392081.1 FG-GAP-like repeat-containing protein [Streptomyces sp. NBC_00094]
MSRYARARRPRARLAVLAAALLASGAGLSPAGTAQASPVVGIDQLDITPNWRGVPRHDTVTAVGPTGYVHATEDSGGNVDGPLAWTDFASGTSTPLGYDSGYGAFAESGTGGRYLYVRPGIGVHALRDLTTGVERPLDVPGDAGYRGLLGSTLLFQQYASATDTSTTTGYYLRSADDLAAAPVPVTGWPAGADLHLARLVAGDDSVAVIRFGRSADPYDYSDLGVVDLRTGRMTVIEAPTPTGTVLVAPVAVSPDRIAWVDGNRTVHVRERADLTGGERTFPLPADLGTARIGLVGDWVLALGETSGGSLARRLVALHPDQGAQTLLTAAEAELTQVGGGGGGVAVVGGTSADDWALLKAVPGKEGGAPVLEKVRRVEPLPAAVASLALGSGRLSTLEPDAGKAGFHARTLPVGPMHTGQSGPAYAGAEPGRLEATTPLFDSGDGRTVHLARTGTGPLEVVARRSTGQAVRVSTGMDEGRIADAFGRWAVFQEGRTSAPGQILPGKNMLVVDLDAGRTALTRTQTAAALWGDTLYGGTATDQVTRTDLATGRTLAAVDTDAPCQVTELQTAGRWLYWACSQFAQQGVVDLRTGAKYALKPGVATGALLGDGYLMERGVDSYLRITEFRRERNPETGQETGKVVIDPARRLVDSTPVSGARREAWTVDRFGGAVAYKDGGNLVHAVWTGVPASDLTAASASAPTTMRSKDGWKGAWVLSKPASYWELTIRDLHSWDLVRTYRGGETRGRVDVAWDGRTAAGKPVTNGPYSWDLTVRTADGQGRDLVASGGITVSGGPPAWRDLAGNDARGDLLVMDTAGLVSMYRGDGFGGLASRIAGTGAKFATTSVPVPFGDVDADGCADVLVRVGEQLRAYRPGCGKVVSASSPYTVIGSGWGQYDVLTSPGDVNGDGFADLVVRQTSTGDMYFYGGTADHRLKARVRIGTNWKLYKKIVGAGDLNGDGRGDLLGTDAAGVMWRYYGTATGGVAARARVGSGWGIYSTLTGIGDISDDGCPDLVARDTSGRLYAYDGTCAGGYYSRRLVGGGWNAFKGLY